MKNKLSKPLKKPLKSDYKATTLNDNFKAIEFINYTLKKRSYRL
jgi:hypothetical protein